MIDREKKTSELKIKHMNRLFNRDLDLDIEPATFDNHASQRVISEGLEKDDYRIEALIQNGKVTTKDHEGNIKTITLRENEALIFVEIYDDSDWRDFQKYIKEEENKKK